MMGFLQDIELPLVVDSSDARTQIGVVIVLVDAHPALRCIEFRTRQYALPGASAIELLVLLIKFWIVNLC